MQTLVDVFNLFADRKAETAFIYRTGVRRLVFTYEELSELALKFSNWLKQQNIQTGDRAALWAPNSPWWAVVYWGCISRGVIVVPIDFMSGRQRAQQIINLSQSKLVIQSQYKVDRLTPAKNVFEIEQLEFILNEFKPADKIYEARGVDIVEIVYTSGTTGNPKGVVLTHKNLTANLDQVLGQIEIKPSYKFLSLLPLSHMFEQLGGFLAPLRVGGQIVYLRTIKPSTMSEALHKEDINVMMAVPRILQALKDGVIRELTRKKLIGIFNKLDKKFADKNKTFKKRLFFPINKNFGRNFKFFVSGGASLDIATFNFWQNLGFTVVEGYGLTECSPVLAVNTLSKQIDGSVGVALPGVDIRIRENEIQARGDNIFTEYWDNPQSSQAAFTSDGWFKTGDLGEFDKAGNLYIKGRRKELIVTSEGINVYPDEIEEVINSISGVIDSCVIGLDRGRGEEIHAVLILEKDISADEVIHSINQQLDPKQRINSSSIWPDATFPKTTTLKIKKFEVKERTINRTDNNYQSSVNKLKELIAFVTKRPVTEIRDDSKIVSDLGLNSLARLELVNLIEQEYRLDLDDSIITLETTVVDIEVLIAKRSQFKKSLKSRQWIHHRIVRLIRHGFNLIFTQWLLKIFISVKAVNVQNLDSLKGPALLIANHASYVDGPSVYLALPRRMQMNFSTIIYEGFFFNKKNRLVRVIGGFWFEVISFVAGIFLATERDGFRRVLEFAGSLVEKNINILFFPEGERSWNSQLLPFQPGLGRMVKELRIPVVPIKITGAYEILPRGKFWPKRGLVTVDFGQPIFFSQETPEEIINQTRQALENM